MESLTRKVGPAPVWVYGVGLGLSINAVRFLRARKAKAAADAAPSSAPADAVHGDGTAPDAASTGLTPSFTYGAAQAPANPAPALFDPGQQIGDTTVAKSGPSDNAGWRNLAADRLISQGYGPSIVLDALRKVLAGEPVTPSEEAIFNLAVRALGSPPEGVPAVQRVPEPSAGGSSPSAPNTPTPAGTPEVKVAQGSTLYGIVAAHYGSAPLARLNAVAKANGLTWNAAHNQVSPWRVGQSVKLPAGL